MDAYPDAWHLMAYDYAGSWSEYSGHDANLYAFSTSRAVEGYMARGVPAGKIVVGIPLYGRAFVRKDGGVSSGSWENGVWDYKALHKAGATVYTDAEAGATYKASAKASYIRSNGLGGAMYCEASADKSGTKSIVTTVLESFGGLEQSRNWLSYPKSQYNNLVAGMPGE
ncbi:hypothetical protein IFR05_012345 [Cadophora sp. M221]|nr:hypothetical protein IFR05_012345 [Cadophora sp. M221]